MYQLESASGLDHETAATSACGADCLSDSHENFDMVLKSYLLCLKHIASIITIG